MRAHKRRGNRPTLRFTPYAWSKLLYLRDVGHTEVGGFGLSGTAGPDQLLRVEDVRLVAQQCTAVSVEFDDTAVADHFDRCVDEGRVPEQFARIWIHTHPGDCALPSPTDEETFARCFGQTDWAVMFILADGGATYARLQFNIGPTVSVRLHVEVEFAPEFAAAEPDAWDSEYEDCVSVRDPFALAVSSWPAASRRTRQQLRSAVFRSRPPGNSGGGSDDCEELDADTEGDSGWDSVVTAELESELQDGQTDSVSFNQNFDPESYCSSRLTEADVDDWSERWMADAVFDPEVPETESDDSFQGKEDRWTHRLSAAIG